MARLAMVMAVAAGALFAAGPADVVEAQANPYQRGPAPTAAALERTGPYAISQATISGHTGFGGGTVYYPTTTADGTFGVIALSPGWTEAENVNTWLGQRLASHGFVVLSINVNNTLLDFPDSRGTQLLAALDWARGSSSPVASRVDGTRQGVGGHSMGGGGTLAAANTRKTIKAAVPMAPWHTNTNWAGVTTPTLIIGGQVDNVAPVASHAEPFYTSIPASTEKAYLEMAGGNHFVTTSPTTTVSRLSVAWFKRFIDNDTRYDQFLCPAPSGSAISEYRHTCPIGGGTTPPPTTPPPTTPPPPTCQWWDIWCWLGF